MVLYQPIVVDGINYDLSHLAPTSFSTRSDKLNREIKTWCRFTTHVFSRTPEDEDTGYRFLDEGNRPRVFCLERYALSLHIPKAVACLENPRYYVHETAQERNWLHRVEITTEVSGHSTQYQIFFAVKKAKGPHDVEMNVESAYAYDPLRVPKLRGRTMIAGLLTATVEGRKIHTQPGGRKR